MSPLAALLMRVLRIGSLASAGFVVLALALALLQHWRAGSLFAMTRPEISFLVILVLMLAGFLWLARSIAREIGKSGP